MNLENIEALIQNKKVKKVVMKILEYEQSQLHKVSPRYKEKYQSFIEEYVSENQKD